ncbi:MULTISPECIES: resuscitation-promoting factor [unclassified Streptomyces]|uniref:resuscitation-promoting factor n=1 Tax=unclassified Streptomyces TaxID=2593676 RepID=UPI001E306024|nr:resuscitation-promoting factor [Streptomyces sp. CB02980]MCB8906316.1 ubiquitin-like domain-containing protein [Streptomyces sp. CB02980]
MSTSQGSHRAGRRGAPLPVHDQPTQAAPLVVPAPGAVPGLVPGQGSRAGSRRAARRRKASGPAGEGLRRLVPQALVVAFLAGGTSAFVADDKAVRLSVDGVPRTLHTFADDVEELLADEGLAVGAHDIVAPAPAEALASGDAIVVRYGRPVALTLDGQRRQVWTTARTVEGALRQLGVRAEGAYLSVSRGAPISRDGLALDVRTERTVTFLADGRERTIRTNAATVREALAEAGITLSAQDATSVVPESFPRDGQTVTVLRITGSKVTREEAVPYAVERARDPELFVGTEVVDRQGAAGVRRVTYSLRTVNGVKQRPRRIGEEIVRDPVSRRVRVGTRPMPTSVAGADGLDWGALAACESGGRPNAVDPSGTYGGLYQFDPGTWRSLGGSGVAQNAPAAEQTFRAKKLYVQRGASPWPHCGRRLQG